MMLRVDWVGDWPLAGAIGDSVFTSTQARRNDVLSDQTYRFMTDVTIPAGPRRRLAIARGIVALRRGRNIHEMPIVGMQMRRVSHLVGPDGD